MTTAPYDENPDLKLIEDGVAAARAVLDRIARGRDEQPERLASARKAADEARGWAAIEEPWDEQWGAVPGYSADGTIGAMMAVPNVTAKELFGSRLLFDVLDCGDDDEAINKVLSRFFSMVHGDTGMAFLLFSSALATCATVVVPQLLEQLEQQGSDYDTRVMLAEARVKAWNGRVAKIRQTSDELAENGVKPVDGYDIASSAMDPDEEEPW